MNSQLRIKIASFGLLLWIIGATLFIFINSSIDYELSHSVSGNLTDAIIDENQNKDMLELFIRKGAHMLEFAFLGASVITTQIRAHTEWYKSKMGFSLFYVLFVAVIDEHIQSFSDRTSSTGDIFLDFFGALIGFAFVIAIHFIYGKIKKRKERRTLVEMVLETEQKEKRG